MKVGVSNFRNAWESIGPDFERVDEYGLGPRESLAEAVSAVISLLGMQPCEVNLVIPVITCIIICQSWESYSNLLLLQICLRKIFFVKMRILRSLFCHGLSEAQSSKVFFF